MTHTTTVRWNVNDFLRVCSHISIPLRVGLSIVILLIRLGTDLVSGCIRQSRQKALILLKQLLIFRNRMKHSFRIHIPLRMINVSIALHVIELKHMGILDSKFSFHFKVDYLRVVDSNRPLLRLLPHNLVDQVHGSRWKLNEWKSFILINIRIHHQPFRQRTKPWVASNKCISSPSRHLRSQWLIIIKPGHGHIRFLLEILLIVLLNLFVLRHTSEKVFRINSWALAHASGRKRWLQKIWKAYKYLL